MTLNVPRIAWWDAEPARLQRDQDEFEEAFPELVYVDEGQGRWTGRLPVWPFDRPRPDGLDDLTRGQGLDMELHYGAAYPMVSPLIFPLDPQPQPLELTQTRWHVLGNRALCLFQTQADWDPASSVVDLLIRAAGWRIEYALLKADVMDDMTMTGIARDDSIDGLVAEAAARMLAGGGGGPTRSDGE
jgi:hypothetical protein